MATCPHLGGHAGGAHAGHVVHGGHAHAGSSSEISPLNLMTFTAFLAWFGGTGYLLERYSPLWFWVILALSIAAGLGGAWLVLSVLRNLLAHERSLNPADYYMVGVYGHVSSTVREGGVGEMLFSQEGLRKAVAVRSEDGVAAREGHRSFCDAIRKRCRVRSPVGRSPGTADVLRPIRVRGSRRPYMSIISSEVFVIAGLMVLAILFLMTMMARLYRKAGPHEALVVYGYPRHQDRERQRHGDFSVGGKLALLVAGADVVRRGAAAGPVHQAGRGGDGGSGGADQGEVGSRVRTDGGRAVPDQDRRPSARA